MTPLEVPEFAPPPEPPPMSEASRLMNVFFAPGQAFADIARRPRWWTPVILAAIVTTAYLYQFSQRVGWELFFRQQNAQNLQLQQLDGAARARAEALQIIVAKYLTWVSGLIGPLIFALVIAVVLKFFADTIMGAGIGYKKTLAAVTYGTLPNLLKTGLAMVVMLFKPADEFDLQNPVMVNAALFVPPDSASWIKGLAASFDLFTFWCMALIAIGMAAGAKRMSAGKAFGMILFPWILMVILGAGFTAAFRS